MIISSGEQTSKIASSLKSGFFDFEVISAYRSENQFWRFLEQLNGQPVDHLRKPEMRQFSLSIALAFGIKPSEVNQCVARALKEKSRVIEAKWVNLLRRFDCSLQDIPEAERSFRVCRQAIKMNAREFYYVPEALKTQELCALAMKKEPVMLFFLPLHLQSRMLYRKAVTKDGRLLTSVPLTYRCEEIYLAAVRQNGLSLEFVPPLEVTPRIAREAVRSNGEALKYVPFHLVTKSLCDEAIRCEPFGAALPFVPTAFRTERMILRVLKSMPLALSHIPSENQSELARQTAVNADGMAIQFIPMGEQSEEVCHKALASNILCWKYVNHNYRISGLLLSVRLRHNSKFPKNIQDAITKLVDNKCELSQMMAKAYLSQMEPHDVARQISITMRRVIALTEIFDNRALAEIYLHNNKIRGAIFRCAMGL